MWGPNVNTILKIIFILVLILIMMNELRLYGGLVGRPHEYAPLQTPSTTPTQRATVVGIGIDFEQFYIFVVL